MVWNPLRLYTKVTSSATLRYTQYFQEPENCTLFQLVLLCKQVGRVNEPVMSLVGVWNMCNSQEFSRVGDVQCDGVSANESMIGLS